MSEKISLDSSEGKKISPPLFRADFFMLTNIIFEKTKKYRKKFPKKLL